MAEFVYRYSYMYAHIAVNILRILRVSRGYDGVAVVFMIAIYMRIAYIIVNRVCLSSADRVYRI